jgi:hypothetical protein
MAEIRDGNVTIEKLLEYIHGMFEVGRKLTEYIATSKHLPWHGD